MAEVIERPKSFRLAFCYRHLNPINRGSLCGGITVERVSHRTGRLACNLSGCVAMETRNRSEKIVEPARIVCMTPGGRCVMAMVGEAGVSKTKVRRAQVRLDAA